MMRSFVHNDSKAGAAAARVYGPRAARGWAPGDLHTSVHEEASGPSAPVTTHSLADVLQRCGKDGKKSNNKKQAKQKAAAAQAKRSKQSKADRNVLRAAQYGDSGRREDVQKNVRERGLRGETIAHGRGSSGSGTSGKYQSIMRNVIEETKSAKSKGGSEKDEKEFRPRPRAVKQSVAKALPKDSAPTVDEEVPVQTDEEESTEESLDISDEHPGKETFRKDDDDDEPGGSGGPGLGGAQEILVI